MAEDSNPTFNLSEAIGDVCLFWSEIESVIHEIILALARNIDKNFKEQTTIDLLHLVIAQMDFRQKVATAKIFAHPIETDLSSGFYDRTEQLLNYLDKCSPT